MSVCSESLSWGVAGYGLNVTPCIFEENFIGLMVTIDASDGPLSGSPHGRSWHLR